MDAYLSDCLMAANLMAACLIAADLMALALDGGLLGESVAAALQFIAKALACMPLRRGDFQFNQSYFDCN